MRSTLRSWRMRCRIRDASSPAALRVNVRPNISSGRTTPLTTSQRTRWVIVSVLPEPAPATTTVGPQCLDSMIARCSSVGSRNRLPALARAWAISSAVISFLRTITPFLMTAFGMEAFIRSRSCLRSAVGRGPLPRMSSSVYWHGR